MRTITTLLLLLLATAALHAQSNFSGFNYQAVVRDTNGDPLPDQNVGVQLVLSCGSLQPYVEDHMVTTDANGLIELVIGEGSPVFGSAPFSTIDWSGCGTWTWNVTVSMDITGGTNYSLVGSQQMKAVPFALNTLSTASQPPTGWTLAGDDVHNTNAGNVGVGTNTPAHKLDVQGVINAGGGLRVGDAQAINNDGFGRMELFDTDEVKHIEFNTFNTIFGEQPTYITDQLGVGLDPAVESASADLHVKGSFRLEDGSEGAGKVLTSDADGNASWGPAAAATGWALNGTHLYNTNSGRIGIGTTTPDAKLTIGTPGVTWTDYGLTSDSRIGVVNGPGSRMAAIMRSSSSGGVFESFDYAANTTVSTLINPNGGNVGIGTNGPAAKLEVMDQSNAANALVLKLNNPSQRRLEVYSPGSDINAPWTFDTPNSIKFRMDGNDSKSLYLDPNGNVAIGAGSPNHKLHVMGSGRFEGAIYCVGKVWAREVEVTLANFPDYVFDKEYRLMPLEEVAAYIQANGHLPNVPSACEVEENGLGLGEMNRILLEKVEELTLHAINSEAEIEVLKDSYQQLVCVLEEVMQHLDTR
ncbi:MAG: hypothetical protein R2818_06885 [Flavobacteriales bacterium]